MPRAPKRETIPTAPPAKPAAQWKLLDESYTLVHDDNILLRALFEVGGERVRITVKSNHYAFQSEAYSEVWSRSMQQWNRVESIPCSQNQAATLQGGYGRDVPALKRYFLATAAALKIKTALVLGV